MPAQEITEQVLEEAMLFALEAHRGQKRKGDRRPYITHPISVLIRLYKYKKSTNIYMLACAAVLHDTVEDCPTVTIERIAREFGFHIASLVQELTLDKSHYEDMGKAEYVSEQINKMTSYAFTLKLLDILDNVCDVDSLTMDKQIDILAEKEYILINMNRKITDTQREIIKDINTQLNVIRHRLSPLV
jgi:(p)ppGpp synthase/HD superfamily hydrolase